MYALSSSRAASRKLSGTACRAASAVRRSATESPRLRAHALEDGLDGFLRRLLGGEARPLVESTLEIAPGVQQIPFCLIHPVPTSLHDRFSIPKCRQGVHGAYSRATRAP